MKITSEHFQTIRESMASVIDANPGFVEYRKGTNLTEKRTAWDIFYASKPAGMSSTRFICDVLYKYLDDTHINTAVLRIYRDITVSMHADTAD